MERLRVLREEVGRLLQGCTQLIIEPHAIFTLKNHINLSINLKACRQ